MDQKPQRLVMNELVFPTRESISEKRPAKKPAERIRVTQ